MGTTGSKGREEEKGKQKLGLGVEAGERGDVSFLVKPCFRREKVSGVVKQGLVGGNHQGGMK